MYVEKSELPNDESNNQFFVWKMPSFNGKRDGNYLEKLKARIGHYIRTEIKNVFEKIDKNYSRYGIDVPITQYEIELFQSNVTNIEATAELTMEKISNYWRDNASMFGTYDTRSDMDRNQHNAPSCEEMRLYQEGYLAYSLVQKYYCNGVHPNAIIKNLKKRGIIGNGERIVVNRVKLSCYQIINSDYQANLDTHGQAA